MKVIIRLLILMIISTLAACGSGGSGGTVTTPVITPPTAKTSAVLKIGTQGAPSATVAGVGLIITLPAGVIVEVDSNGNVPISSANVSGVAQGWGFVATYNAAANATSSSTLTLVTSLNSNVFQTGELFTVTCKLPSGNVLTSNDFTTTAIVTSFNPSDPNLTLVNGLQPTLVPILQ